MGVIHILDTAMQYLFLPHTSRVVWIAVLTAMITSQSGIASLLSDHLTAD
jgi:hypothetical protein